MSSAAAFVEERLRIYIGGSPPAYGIMTSCAFEFAQHRISKSWRKSRPSSRRPSGGATGLKPGRIRAFSG